MSDSSSPGPGRPDADDADVTSVILGRLSAHGSRQSRYQMLGEVARGGMGLILRVWDEDLRRELAMKVVLGEAGKATPGEVPPKVMGRFLEEAQVTGQLDHPGIVPVHELGLDERGAAFFTMRLVKGRDLKEVFALVEAGDREWTRERVLWALLKVCDAMAYAHSKGVIHRDLKPANVMVGRFGEVYVMDWGLARVVGQPDRHDLRLRRESMSLSLVQTERRADASHSTDSVLYTMDGDVVGTPAYMSPEQARGEIERLGPRSDVYSLGGMLYHLLSGQAPYIPSGGNVSQHMVLRWVLEEAPRPIHKVKAGVPEALTAICEKAMARDPARRYADMGELGEDLRAYLENRVVKAHRTGAWIEFKKWVQRNRKLALAWSAAAGIAVLGLGATLLVQVSERRKAEEAREMAQRSERAAEESLGEARRQEAIARRERSNVLRLSAFQELGDLEREADRLWPAVPERIEALEAWLGRAEHLVAGLQPGTGGEPGHLGQLTALEARAERLSPEEQARRLEAHPRAPELLNARSKLEALRAAAAARRRGALDEGRARDLAALATGIVEPEALVLNERAWPLIDPARGEFGRELEGLALARAALERAEPAEEFLVADTLAWASLANGLDQEALEIGRSALQLTPPGHQGEFEDSLALIFGAVQVAESPAGAAAVRAAEEPCEELEREVFGRPVVSFASDDDRWWHGQLAELVRSIEAFDDARTGLVRGLSEPHGWGIERRLAFARTVAERSIEGPEASALWSSARATIADPGRCPAYAGLELEPQLGLVPLGLDPESRLYEFADLQTGEAPRRADDGRLELAPGSSVVFVLVPGGLALVGAQAADPRADHFDPAAMQDEAPVHAVRLEPFFLSKYELTQGQWRRFTGGNPSRNLAGTQRAGRALSELSPVEQVSWLKATRVLERLGWELPTEVQWEYATRAGEGSPWWAGEDVRELQGVANLSDRYAREQGAPQRSFEESLEDGYKTHAPVGSFEANFFGLHDVTGNVYEWCRDEYGPYALKASSGDGLRLGADPTLRVIRGGSFVTAANGARSAKRDSGPPDLQNESIGLRPMRRLR